MVVFVVVFEKESSVLPELEVLDFLVQSSFAECNLVFEGDCARKETHFLYIPAVVVCLSIGDEPLC